MIRYNLAIVSGVAQYFLCPRLTTWRLCVDFRKVNSITKTDSHPMHRDDDCIDQIGHTKYVSMFDMLKGYW